MSVATRRIVSHSVGMVIYRIAEDGTVEFAVMSYSKPDNRTGKPWESVRIPVGTGEASESLVQTLQRETHEEVAKDSHNFSVTPLHELPIWAEFAKDQDIEEGIHLKTYFATAVEGALRDQVIMDGDETLGPLEWNEAEFLLTRRMKQQSSLRNHRMAIAKVLERLCGLKEIGERYGHLLAKVEMPKPLSAAEIEEIKAYMA